MSSILLSVKPPGLTAIGDWTLPLEDFFQGSGPVPEAGVGRCPR